MHTKTSARWILAAVVLIGCAPGVDETAPAATPEVNPLNDPARMITEAEQAAGVEDTGEDHTEPYDGIDGNTVGLAPPIDEEQEYADPDEGVLVDAVTGCRPATGYSRGNPTRICVVSVQGKLVEQRTAIAFESMRRAAARSGVTLQIVSGFRSMDQQRYLYNLYLSGRGNLAARPGYSNHQSGLALDLNMHLRGVSSWLASHAASYGFRRTVPSENWHWERPAGSQGGYVPSGGGGGRSDGNCYSNTLGRSMSERVCVQSRFDNLWYQCRDGLWRRGRGSQGTCSNTYPLGSSPGPTTGNPVRGTCYSATSGAEEPVGTCLQSRLDRQWYQCATIGWVQNDAIPSRHAGYAGSCTRMRPLQ